MSKKFQRTIENFQCEHCGKQIEGNGYTNHCPFCLWSKHVDINPGDRENLCQGMMQPTEVFLKSGNWYLKQRCQRCGYEGIIKTKKKDSIETLQKILDQMVKG